MQTLSGKLKQKLEQDAGFQFHKLPDTNGLEKWVAFDEQSNAVAMDKCLGPCIMQAAKKVGEV